MARPSFGILLMLYVQARGRMCCVMSVNWLRLVNVLLTHSIESDLSMELSSGCR